MDKPYFVMLYTQNGHGVAPLVDEKEEVCQFNSGADAFAAGQRNVMGAAFGFEVFEVGEGIQG